MVIMGLRDLFRRKTRREKYEKAEKKKEGISGELENTHKAWLNTEYDVRQQESRWRDARDRLKELYAEGHEEALQLNKKYDTLVSEAEKVVKKYQKGYDKAKNQTERDSFDREWMNVHKKLYDFEKKELGMHKNGDIKKNIGTMVGVVSVASFVLSSFIAINITGNVIYATGNFSNSTIFLAVGFVFGIAWLILRR